MEERGTKRSRRGGEDEEEREVSVEFTVGERGVIGSQEGEDSESPLDPGSVE